MPNILDLTDTEAVLLNTLYAIMVAGANDQKNAVEGSYALFRKVASGMTSEEMVTLNEKMSQIVRNVPRAVLESFGIEGDGYSLTELDRKYGEVLDEVPDEDKRMWN